MSSPVWLTALFLAVALCGMPIVADATALRPGKATDDSVCDLGPDTNQAIASKTLIPGILPDHLQADAYRRLATRFVVNSCKQGQLLIVHARQATSVDSTSLQEVASSLCVISMINRTEITTPSPHASAPVNHGFELRCQITKLEQLRASFAEQEKADPTDAFIARLHAQARAESGAATLVSPAGPSKDCSKLTLSTLFTGGSCR